MTPWPGMASDSATESTLHAKQIVFLFMAATVVAVVVFLCGVLVGRGVPVGGAPETSARLGTLQIDDLPPPILSTPSAEPSAAATTSDDLTYPSRLSGEMTAPERIREPAEADIPAEASDEVVTPPVEELVETVAPESPSPIVPAGALVLQVMALRAEVGAQAVAEGLVARGYRAFVVQPLPDEPETYYRVRVGPFATESDAARVRDRLRNEEGLVPYITR